MNNRNTPAQDTGIAPSVLLFGRPLRDHLPRFERKLRSEWERIADSREVALAKRTVIRVPTAGRELQPLKIGDCVQIQNQTGNNPTKWDSTGVITGVLPHRQYQVVKDGSRRITLRNRRFLKKIMPISRKEYMAAEYNPVQPLKISEEALDKVDKQVEELIPNINVHDSSSIQEVELPTIDTPKVPGNCCQNQIDKGSPRVPTDGIRRSVRQRAPRKFFSARLEGKSHEHVVHT